MALFRPRGQLLLLSYLLYLKQIFHHSMILSGGQRNVTIFFFSKCSSYSRNINVKNYDNFWSYDNGFYFKFYLGVGVSTNSYFHMWTKSACTVMNNCWHTVCMSANIVQIHPPTMSTASFTISTPLQRHMSSVYVSYTLMCVVKTYPSIDPIVAPPI